MSAVIAVAMAAATIVVVPAVVVTAAATATVIVFRFIAHRKVSYGYETLNVSAAEPFFKRVVYKK